jgi:hypothetical protein
LHSTSCIFWIAAGTKEEAQSIGPTTQSLIARTKSILGGGVRHKHRTTSVPGIALFKVTALVRERSQNCWIVNVLAADLHFHRKQPTSQLPSMQLLRCHADIASRRTAGPSLTHTDITVDKSCTRPSKLERLPSPKLHLLRRHRGAPTGERQTLPSPQASPELDYITCGSGAYKLGESDRRPCRGCGGDGVRELGKTLSGTQGEKQYC